jgi:hypothetical protein
MIPRREFVRSVAVAAAFVAARPVLNAINGERRVRRIRGNDLPDCAEFERLCGTKFKVTGAHAGDQWLELDQVLRQSRGRRVESFSVRFRGAASAELPERIYRFSHSECDDFDFFITSGSVEGSERTYRAVVCRLT